MSEQAVASPPEGGAWWPADRVFPRPPEPFEWRAVSRRALAVLSGLVVLRAVVYAVRGAQLILDDYSILASIRYSGVGDAADTLQWGRPVAWLVDTAVYGGVGAHPLVLLAIITALNLVAVVLLYLVMGRFVPSRFAFFVAAVWVLAANHNTLTIWTATGPTVVALCLLLGGTLALTNGRWIVAAVCLGLSVWSYELTFPLAFVAALFLPSAHPLGWRPRLAMMGSVAAATGWVVLDPLNSPDYQPPALALVWRAHFSDGLLGTTEGPTRLVHYLGDLALVGLVAAAVAWLLGRRGRDDGAALALAGIAVMVLGSVAFAAMGLGRDGIGMQDRLLAASSIGAAMVLVGVLQMASRHVKGAAIVAGVVLCGVLVAGQFVSLRAWAHAGEDALSVNDFVAAVADPSDETPINVTIGPEARGHNGVLGISSHDGSAQSAYRLRFGQFAGDVRVVRSAEEFVIRAPGELLLDWAWIDNAAVFEEGVGFIAVVTVPGPGLATVYGWAEDGGPDAAPVEVELLVDGEPVGRTIANVDRADIALALGRPNPNHAFVQDIEVPAGEHTVCARTVGHGDVSLGCEDIVIQAAPEVVPPAS